MHSFFALNVETETQREINKWSILRLPDKGIRFSENTFNIRLCGFAAPGAQRIEDLAREVDNLAATRIEIILDTLCFFPRHGEVKLTSITTPTDLGYLVDRLRRLLNQLNIKTSHRPYQPYITLLRDYPEEHFVDSDGSTFLIKPVSMSLYQSTLNNRSFPYVELLNWDVG